MTNGNHQAFGYGFDKKERNPRYGRGSSEEFLHDTVEYKGLTKRELMATEILAGMYSNNLLVDQWNCEQIMAENAVKATNALIAELNKQTSTT